MNTTTGVRNVERFLYQKGLGYRASNNAYQRVYRQRNLKKMRAYNREYNRQWRAAHGYHNETFNHYRVALGIAPKGSRWLPKEKEHIIRSYQMVLAARRAAQKAKKEARLLVLEDHRKARAKRYQTFIAMIKGGATQREAAVKNGFHWGYGSVLAKRLARSGK